MVAFECPHELDVVDAVTTGRWPSRCDAELIEHVGGCRICTDLVTVLGPLLEEAEAVRQDARVPPAAVVWWRARLRAREEAARVALRPISIAQGVGAVFVVAVLAALVVLAAPSLKHSGALLSERLSTLGGALTAITSLADGWLPVAAAVGVSIIVAPLALYLALARD